MSRKTRKPKPDRRDGYVPVEPKSQDVWTSPVVLTQLEQRARETHLDAWNVDGFKNELTGIGDYLRDKTLGGREGGPEFFVYLMSGIECENRWRGSDLGARVVETIPDEMTREGWEVSIQPDEEEGEERADAFPPKQPGGPPGAPPMMPQAPPEPKVGVLPEADDTSTEQVEELEGKLEELGTVDAFWDALCYERAYGGAGILIGADDGFDLDKPLNEEGIDDVTHLTAFRGGWDGELVAWSYYQDPTQPKYGQPEYYMLRNLNTPPSAPVPGSTGKQAEIYVPRIYWVHESRLLIFPGTAVSRYARQQMRGWGDSVFTRCNEILSQYNQTWGGVANLMQEFSQGILSIKGFAESLMANNRNGTKTVTNRALALNLSRSMARMLLIDSEEEFKRDTVSLGGIGELLQQFALRLAAAADMPVTLLMGQAPAGLNATGESDVRFFYDRIRARQKKRMLPQLRRLVKLLLLSKQGPTGGREPARWNLKCNPLFQMSEKEQADLRKVVADTDVAYINAGVLSAEEVAASAYGGSEWTMERTIDMAGRREMADQDEKDKAERQKAMQEAMNNPPPPDENGAPEEPKLTEPAEEPKEEPEQ